jgi:hypothetical protein
MAHKLFAVQEHGTQAFCCSGTWHTSFLLFRNMSHKLFAVQEHGAQAFCCSGTWRILW